MFLHLNAKNDDNIRYSSCHICRRTLWQESFSVNDKFDKLMYHICFDCHPGFVCGLKYGQYLASVGDAPDKELLTVPVSLNCPYDDFFDNSEVSGAPVH